MGYGYSDDDSCYYCDGYTDYGTSSADAFQCKNCNKVVHIQCLRNYELMDDGGAYWQCPNCHTRQRAI
ncbi:hypothetical protein EXE46_05235 [Halorubrum sp. GN11_10-6_MGM]|nr:hypothetical protein EXE46_05235 [Halorubrum sp. GN11_10-6_MGM]